MSEAAILQEHVSTLKTLNNTIVTIRTFPAKAPQAANAIERGYKSVKKHLQKWGDFSLASVGDDLLLCGETLSQETVRSISNLIVYRQLELLESQECRVKHGIDRDTFEKVLEVLSAKVDQIKQEGGGLGLVRKLGVEDFFFKEDSAAAGAGTRKQRTAAVDKKMAPGRQVRKELVDVLLGRETRKPITEELISMLADPKQGVQVFIASLAGILEGLRQNKIYANSSALNQIFANYENFTTEEQHQEFMRIAADTALQDYDLPVLALLMSQSFQTESGKLFSSFLLQNISSEQFAGVIRELREGSSRLRPTEIGDSRQLQFLNDAVRILLATAKGKQYLGKEKAQNILTAGEKARKAQRVLAGVRALVKGNIEVLGGEEFITHLPSVLQKMESDGLETEIQDVLKKLSRYFAEADAEGQPKLIRSLVQIAENLMSGELWDKFELIAEPLLIWVRDSDIPDDIYERACVCLQAFMGQSWQEGKYRNGDRVLSLLYRIRSGNLKKNDEIRILIGRVQDRRIDNELLVHLLCECLANPNDEVTSRRLILQGPIASRFLIERLMLSENPQDSSKIVDLLTYGEKLLPAIIVEKLAEPMPWYGKRNLLKLLAETGGAEHVSVAFPFLQHEDMRVQREAFVCLYKISGAERKTVLLQGLAEAGEAMKLQIIKALAPMSDAEVINGLEQVLADYRYYSEEFRDVLMMQACRVLARSPLPEPVRVLRDFIEQQGTRQAKKIGSAVWAAATEALDQLEESQRIASRGKKKPAQVRVGARRPLDSVDSGGELQIITGLEEERQIHELVDKGQNAPARELLLRLISSMARQRRFKQAEKLRQWLIKVDPLALKDIIRASDIIEDEQQNLTDNLQQDSWLELSDSLSTEEFSAFFQALERRHYGSEEVIVQKGDEQRALYFINSGRVKLYCREKGKDTLVRLLQPCEILGAEGVSDAAAWAFSAAALGQADIAMLRLEQLQQWQETFPTLGSKLKQFCEHFAKGGESFEFGDKDRGMHVREPLEPTAVSMALLDENERSFGVELKGELIDLSRGGISLLMPITRKDNTRLLLGRSIQLFLPYGESGEKTITFHGKIVAVRAQKLKNIQYSIHIEFFKELSEAQIDKVADLAALGKVADAMSGS